MAERPVAVLDEVVKAKGKQVPPAVEEEVYHSYKDIVTECWQFGNPKKILQKEWRKPIAEFFGTMMLVFFGTGAAIAALSASGFNSATIVVIALGFGIAAATAIYAVSNISGGHINPAVTIGMFVAMKIPLFLALLYIGAQLTGAIVASALIKGALPNEILAATNYGATGLNKGYTWNTGKTSGVASISAAQGVLLEICLTFTLVLTVLSVVKIPKETSNFGRHAPLAIGFSILIGHLVGSPFTGPSMNPARSFGPAVVSGYWQDHWVFWVGPIVGAIFAALIYKYLFIKPMSRRRRMPVDFVDHRGDIDVE